VRLPAAQAASLTQSRQAKFPAEGKVLIDRKRAINASVLRLAWAWLALGAMLLLGLLHLGGWGTAGQGAWRATELSAAMLLALLLPAAALLLLERAPRLAGLIGLATMVLTGMLLLKWSMRLDDSDLLANRAIDGVSVLGRYALGAWLFCAGVVCWALGSAGLLGLSIAMSTALMMSLAVCAAAVFALSCWLIFGELPGSSVLISMPVLAAAATLALALMLAAWDQVARRSASRPEESYRWLFMRQLSLLLSVGVLAGLAAASLLSMHAAELLTEGVQNRTTRQAQALERYARRSAATVQALYERSGPLASDALLRELRRVADRVQLAEDGQDAARQGWPQAVPILRRAEFSVGLQADGGVRIELAPRQGRGPLWVRLQSRQVPGLFTEQDRQPLSTQQLLCVAQAPEQLSCADIVAPLSEAASGATPPFALQTAGAQFRAAGLTRIYGPFTGRSLAAIAPIGELGAQIVLKVDAASLFKSIGGPLLLAMLVMTSLALLGAAWSYWRQLPVTRELYLSRAQAEATMQHVPLATLVLDAEGLVLQANPAAQELLEADGQSLQGRSIAMLLPDWRGAPAPGTDARQRMQAINLRGAALPVEVFSSGYSQLGQQRRLLMLRDLRAERRDAQERQRWRHVFDDAGWGMAIASIGADPLLELVNPAYARMLGCQPADLLGKPVRAGIVPACWDTLLQLRVRAERGGMVQAQLRHQRQDGQELPTLLSLSAVRDEQGELSHFVVSVQDIGELKQAEEQATRHATYLRAALDALPVGVWIGDAQGMVQQTNRTAQRLWEQADAAPGGAIQPWARGQHALIDHDSLMRRAAIMNATVDSGLIDLALPGGSHRTLLTTASPMLDAAGKVIGAIAIDEDLSSLRRGELALRHAHDLLERILEACAVGIALCDAKGQVLRRNLAWNLLIGSAADADALGQTLDPDDSLRRRELIGRVARGELPTYVGEHRMLRASGATGWTMLVVSRLSATPEEAGEVLVQVLDVDDRRQIADEIAASHLRLAAAQKLARMGDWQWDVSLDRVSCSDQMLSMLGYGTQVRETLTRARLMQLVHPDEKERLAGALDQALSRLGRLDQDVRLIRADGEEMMVHVHGVAQRTPAGMSMAGTIQDVTERKRIESELLASRERLRELVAYEGEVIEEERKRIAREVHDELGQLLTALRLDLAVLHKQLPVGAEAQRAERMRETMATMTDVVRHIASNLRPAALDLGLVAAIEWLAEDYSLRWETRCDVKLPSDFEPELPESVALAMFRAVQESLTNIAKHAQASRVSIELQLRNGELHLRVSDDGHGFDADEVAARRGGGLGLLGMRERMHAIGAQLEISTGPGGTSVEISYKNARSTYI